jgi:hypothetical protein
MLCFQWFGENAISEPQARRYMDDGGGQVLRGGKGSQPGGRSGSLVF